jgi:hypothetical protein
VRVNPIVESELFGCRRVLEPRTDHCLETGLSCGTTLRTDLDPPAVPGNVSGEPILQRAEISTGWNYFRRSMVKSGRSISSACKLAALRPGHVRLSPLCSFLSSIAVRVFAEGGLLASAVAIRALPALLGGPSKVIEDRLECQETPTLLFYQIKALCVKAQDDQKTSTPYHPALQMSRIKSRGNSIWA